jgi:hypothetical protein
MSGRVHADRVAKRSATQLNESPTTPRPTSSPPVRVRSFFPHKGGHFQTDGRPRLFRSSPRGRRARPSGHRPRRRPARTLTKGGQGQAPRPTAARGTYASSRGRSMTQLRQPLRSPSMTRARLCRARSASRTEAAFLPSATRRSPLSVLSDWTDSHQGTLEGSRARLQAA